jgi:hypothetical protein
MPNPAYQLFVAFRNEDYDEVNELINRHGGFNKVVNENGSTAIHLAANNGQVPILQKIWKMFRPDIDQKNNSGDTPLQIASYNSHFQSIKWFVGHGSDPQAKNDRKKTAKDYAKNIGILAEVVEFLDKVDAMKELFPVKEVSPLNYFSIGNYAEELEEYLTNVETDDPEYLEILKAMETTKLLAIKFDSKEVANVLDQHFPTYSAAVFPTPSNELKMKKVQKALCLINIGQEMMCENDPDEERLTVFNQHLNAAKSVYDTVLEQEF